VPTHAQGDTSSPSASPSASPKQKRHDISAHVLSLRASPSPLPLSLPLLLQLSGEEPEAERGEAAATTRQTSPEGQGTSSGAARGCEHSRSAASHSRPRMLAAAAGQA
jgi:hypothetical protein